MDKREIFSLTQLQKRVGEGVEATMPPRFWIRAESGEVKVNVSGHCYMELIERDKESRVTAKISAIIWASRYRILAPFFEQSTGSPLTRGVTILVEATINYSPLYGLSLIISNIDPTFTIGEQELERQRTIAKLEKEGMIGLNSQLPIPPLPRNIAIISSERAAGYRDFIVQLTQEGERFNINYRLFSATMQGEGAVPSIINALDAIAGQMESFQLVVIVRGGGGAQDLVPFDNYELALNIAQYPLPVIVGVGHDHDYHVADMVAHTHLKTPTATASFIAQLFIAEEQQLYSLSHRLSLSLKGRVEKERGRLKSTIVRIENGIRSRVERESYKIGLLENKVKMANPINLLERGFAMVYHQGVRTTSGEEIEPNSEITILLAESKLRCRVEEKEKLR